MRRQILEWRRRENERKTKEKKKKEKRKEKKVRIDLGNFSEVFEEFFNP